MMLDGSTCCVFLLSEHCLPLTEENFSMKFFFLLGALHLSIFGLAFSEKSIELDQVAAISGLPALNATHHRDAAIANLANRHANQALPPAGEELTVFGQTFKWQHTSPANATKSLDSEGEIALLRAHLESDRFVPATFKVQWPGEASLFINGKKVSGTKSEEVHSFKTDLINASHRLFLILEAPANASAAEISLLVEDEAAVIAFDLDPMRRPWMEDFYYLDTTQSLAISPNGTYVGAAVRRFDTVTQAWENRFSIWKRASKERLFHWRGDTPSNLTFTPDNTGFVYTLHNKIWHQQFDGSSPVILLEQSGDIGNFFFAQDGQTLIYQWFHSEEGRKDGVKRYRGLEDRWSYWRRRAQVFRLDLSTGLSQQMTDLPYGTNIHDVQGDRLLFSTTLPEYDEPPYVAVEIKELSLQDGAVKDVIKLQFPQGARFAPEGYYLLLGPNALGGAGKTTEEPGNDYDGQLIHLKADGKTHTSLSKDFAPAITDFQTLPGGDLLISAIDRASTQMFHFKAADGSFSHIKTQNDTHGAVALSGGERPTAVFTGSSMSRPESIYTMDLGVKQAVELDTPGHDYFRDVKFGNIREYGVRTEEGKTIPGRIYFPPNFDPEKKYPSIVYYYGGVVPVGRGFTGRYPFHMWSAQGYLVYVLQPTGTVGWGQEKSAKHVNAWGRYTADDIIDATRTFLAEHKYADPERVGCMGASYGGFMTMYLQTRTDLFSAAVAHAGISELTGYWGFGWWGYLYSGIATRNSFPWNAKELYTLQSPVYAADKVNTPILLVTGDSDTNVPASQSHVMYTALKLLGKDVDLVEVEGENHHINDPIKRMIWWNTISSYFDRHLKDQPQWWETIYPK
jgi:acylaminoacyl-peptidase